LFQSNHSSHAPSSFSHHSRYSDVILSSLIFCLIMLPRCHLSTASTSHTFQPYQTACQEYAYLTHFSPTFLIIAAHRYVLCTSAVVPFFSLVTLRLILDLLTLPYVLSISVLFFTQAIQPPFWSHCLPTSGSGLSYWNMG